MIKTNLFILALFSCLSVQIATAQYPVWDDPNNLPIWMTPGEELRRHEIGKNFMRTGEPTAPVRSISEFERQQGVLVRYYNGIGIPYSLVADMSQQNIIYTIVANTTQKNSAITNYTNNGVNMANCQWIIAPTNSMWTRDYGPQFIADGNEDINIVDFVYNRPRPDDDAIPGVVANFLGITSYGTSVVHTGGNYMSDGLGIAASTDLVYEENNNNSGWVNQQMQDYFGINTYHVTIDPLDDYIKHIDCWGKFLDVDKVLIAEVPASDSRYEDYEEVANYFEQQISSYGTPYTVYRVYEPSGQPYTNSLILNKKVYVPIKNSSYDAAALAVYQEAMPGYTIQGVYSSSWQSTDALHCRAIGIADIGMLYVQHIPIHGTHEYQPTFQVSADIIPHSGEELKTDSLFVIYKANAGDFDTVNLVYSQNHTYTGLIPVAQGDTLITYYLFAADQSGRRENWPLIGASGARSFRITNPAVPVTGVTVSPLAATLNINQTQQLTASVLPENATNQSVTWSTSNESVATVDAGGLVTGMSSGTAVITVTTVDGGYTATSDITVEATGNFSEEVTYTAGDVPTDDAFTSLPASSGCPGYLTVTIPAGAAITDVDVSYSMTGSHYGYISDQRSQLRCTSPGGISEPELATGSGNYSGTYDYNRTNLDIANGVSGGGDILFELHTGRTWSSATYSGCQTYNNQVDNNTWTVTVHYTMVPVLVTSITVAPISANLLLNETLQLTAAITPENATNKQVNWTSGNTTVATINALGLVTATGPGSATITATTVTGGFTATCEIAVTVPVTGVTVTPGSVSLATGEQIQVDEEVLPSNATDQSVAWSSSNPSVATVSTSGLVTAVSAGSAQITVTTNDGGFTASCAVMVEDYCTPAGYITFERWNNIPGSTIPDLTGNENYPDNPSSSTALTLFEIPTNVADNYGVRVSGYLCAPLTGPYRFWIAGDDNVELWLSSDDNEANKIKIAYHNGYTKPRQWNKYSTQRSAYIYLVGGTSYYIEALMKHSYGKDNMAVGWLKPGQWGTSPSQVVPGSVLSPREEPYRPERMIVSIADPYTTDHSDRITFQVYPNPTTGLVTLAASGNPKGPVNISVLSSGGQLIIQQRVSFETSLVLNLENLSPGYCLIRIETKDIIEYKKVIILK